MPSSAYPDSRLPPNGRQYGASVTNYSRHGSTPPGSRPNSGTNSRLRRRSGHGNRNQNAGAGHQNGEDPPLLQRDGPPASYQDKMNLHQDYQGRNGHLKVGNTTWVYNCRWLNFRWVTNFCDFSFGSSLHQITITGMNYEGKYDGNKILIWRMLPTKIMPPKVHIFEILCYENKKLVS